MKIDFSILLFFYYSNGPLNVVRYINKLYLMCYYLKIGARIDHIVKMDHL